MKNKTETIKHLLVRHPEALHDDKRFIVEFWRMEQPLICNFGSAATFMREFVNGKFTNPETILRLKRQALKEHNDLLTPNAGGVSPAKHKTNLHKNEI